MRDLSDDELTKRAINGTAIDLGDEISERGQDLGLGSREHRLRLAVQVGLELVVAASHSGELRHILLGHPRGPIEALRIDWRGARDGGGGDYPVGQQRGKCDRMRRATGASDGIEAVVSEHIGNRRHVSGTAGHRPARKSVRAPVSRPRVGDVTKVALRAHLDQRIEHLRSAWCAVMGEQPHPVAGPGEHDLEHPAVTGGNRHRVDVPSAHGAKLPERPQPLCDAREADGLEVAGLGVNAV